MVLDDSTGSTIEIFCKRESITPSQTLVGKGSSKGSLVDLNNKLEENQEVIGLTAQGNMVNFKGIDIGSIIKVKGGVGEFRQEKQVLLERVCRYCLGYVNALNAYIWL